MQWESVDATVGPCQKLCYISDMASLAEKIASGAEERPEGTPLSGKEFLHLGTRAAVDQAFSRLAKRGVLMRAGRGIYVQPVKSKHGVHAPSTAALLERLSATTGVPIAPTGAAAANALGLTTQVPVREVYLTAGRSRKLRLGARTVELRHAPSWQLVLPGRVAGDVVRALAWMGPGSAHSAIEPLRKKLSPAVLTEIAATRPQLPTWMAQQVSGLVCRG